MKRSGAGPGLASIPHNEKIRTRGRPQVIPYTIQWEAQNQEQTSNYPIYHTVRRSASGPPIYHTRRWPGTITGAGQGANLWDSQDQDQGQRSDYPIYYTLRRSGTDLGVSNIPYKYKDQGQTFGSLIYHTLKGSGPGTKLRLSHTPYFEKIKTRDRPQGLKYIIQCEDQDPRVSNILLMIESRDNKCLRSQRKGKRCPPGEQT